MNIPYYKQQTKYTCGPACMRMVLASLGLKKDEKYLAKKLRTNKIVGTWHKYIPRIAEKYKLDYIIQRNGSFSELKRLYRNKWRIIICYNLHKDPHVISRNDAHYAVIKKINWHSIYLLDPYYGEKVRYFIRTFKHRWKDYEDHRWFAAIKKSQPHKFTHVNQ